MVGHKTLRLEWRTNVSVSSRHISWRLKTSWRFCCGLYVASEQQFSLLHLPVRKSILYVKFVAYFRPPGRTNPWWPACRYRLKEQCVMSANSGRHHSRPGFWTALLQLPHRACETAKYLERCVDDESPELAIEEVLSAYVAWKLVRGQSCEVIIQKLRYLTMYLRVMWV